MEMFTRHKFCMHITFVNVYFTNISHLWISYTHNYRLRGILSVITAGSPMVGTPINLVQGLIILGLIKDLNLAITIRRPLEWLKRGLKERWSCRESNPGPLAYHASALVSQRP